MRVSGNLAGTTALFLAGCVSMQPTVVDPDRYLGRETNPASIYETGAAPALLPLWDVRFQPMKRLMLVNFGDDPVYEGIELQTFDAPGGESALALLWRRDGVVDVYMTPNHEMDPAARRGIENLLNRTTMQRAEFAYRLEVSEHGLDAALRMTDREGREVRFEIVETRGTPYRGALIAPVGAQVEQPEYLPIVFLDDFALVRRRGARIEVVIDGERRTPDRMTRLVKGPASYFTRYSTRVVIAQLNERRDARLSPVAVDHGAALVRDGDIEHHLSWNGGVPETDSMVARAGGDRVALRFSPAFPALLALREGSAVEGRWVLNVNAVEGIVAGEYRVRREGEGVRLELQPLNAWQPPILQGPPWIASYRYEASLALEQAGARLTAGWARRAE